MHDRAGDEHVREYTSEDALAPGSIVELHGRHWLAGRTDGDRVEVWPGVYRLTLRHPDGREEAGAFRRLRADAPGRGHQFTTLAEGAPISWEVVDDRLAHDEAGAPFLELIAVRDYGEAESLPDHQLEHALDRGSDGDAAAAVVTRAEAAGLAIELVALEPGEVADWDEAGRFIDALVLDEIGDDLLQMCGVDPNRDRRDSWLETVQGRLRDDLQAFRADVDANHDEIEEWDFRGGRIFAAVGPSEDESNPLSAFGWMCRLVDSDALGAAGFRRVHKALIQP